MDVAHGEDCFRSARWYCYTAAADIGWIAGLSYTICGPLANGCSTFMFESVPTHPNPGRHWDLIQVRARACAYGLLPTAMVDGPEIEAAGPLILLKKNFPDLFRGSLWLHLVCGSSSVTQGDVQIGAKWSQVQRLHVSNGLAVWVGLSRGQLVHLVTFAFRGSLLRALRQVLGRRALMPTRCWRCPSERMGARRSTGSARWFLFPTNT